MTPDQMRDASLLELFRMEAEAQKQVLDTGLLILERDPLNAGQLEACMRAAHSLKGASRIVGLDSGVQVAHAMEDLLVAAQEGLLRLLPDHIDALLQGSDLLLRIGQAQSDSELETQVKQLTSRLQALLGAAVPTLREQPTTQQTPPQTPAPEPVSNAQPAPTLPPAEPASEEHSRVLRVSAERFDHLIDLSGKSLVEFQRMKPLSDSLHRLKRQQAAARRTYESLREQLLGLPISPAIETLLNDGRHLLMECQQQLQSHQELFDDFVWHGGQRTQQLYDLALASRYSELVTDARLRKKVFTSIEAEWHRTAEALTRITGDKQRLTHNTALARSIKHRFPYIDPLHHLQVELVRRWRAGQGDERVQTGIHISINGIAAGLRNTG